MSTRFFSSPRTASAAAATAPARLAATSDADIRWRICRDGTLEVVEVRDGRIDRYVVNDDGTTAPGALVPLSFSYRWAKRVAFAGWGVCFLGILVGGLAGLGDAFVAIVFFAGAVFFVGGGIAHARALDFEKRLDGGGWHEPTDLHGWVPRTGPQLTAVEQIADDSDGLAYVRDTGGRIVDVYAMRRGEVALRWVDEAGNSGVTSIESYSPRHALNRILRRFALVEFMKHRPQDGSEWIEIRTRLVVDDGD